MSNVTKEKVAVDPKQIMMIRPKPNRTSRCLRPARFTAQEVAEFLEQFQDEERVALTKLLLNHGNEPVREHVVKRWRAGPEEPLTNTYETINKALKNIRINGHEFHLEMTQLSPGAAERYYQLWEISR